VSTRARLVRATKQVRSASLFSISGISRAAGGEARPDVSVAVDKKMDDATAGRSEQIRKRASVRAGKQVGFRSNVAGAKSNRRRFNCIPHEGTT
jgi:hypothetical protein